MILAATEWGSNAAMIVDVNVLGYLPAGLVVDVTYGKGNWWKRYRPPGLVGQDLITDGVDYRALPEADGSVKVIAFDPPYIAQGGRASSTEQEFISRYGLVDVATSPAGVLADAKQAFTEFHRVLEPRGLLLMKAMNYVTCGHYNPAAYDMLGACRDAGFKIVDELIYLRRPGPQPARARQLHARRNYSHLFVMRKGTT